MASGLDPEREGGPSRRRCGTCQGLVEPGWERCWGCRTVQARLGAELTAVVPLARFLARTRLHRLLVGYKAAPTARAREVHADKLSAMLSGFIRGHLRCVVDVARSTSPGGEIAKRPVRPRTPIDVLIVPVPSSSTPRPSWNGVHPLTGIARAALARRGTIPAATRVSLAPVLVRGPARLDHLLAHRDGFVSEVDLLGATAVVLDDVYTTGARAQSAAFALRAAGADVAGIVVLGRLIRPDHFATCSPDLRFETESDPRACTASCLLPPPIREPRGPEPPRPPGPERYPPRAPRHLSLTDYGNSKVPRRREAASSPSQPSPAR